MKDVFTDENVRKVVVPLAITGILALTFVAGIRILSNTALQIKNKGYVNVKGFAKKEIRADLAVLQATIVSEDIELKNCYAKLDLDKEKVKTHLKKHYGLTDKEMMFEPASIEEIYKINERGYNTDQFVKYVLKQNVRLELKDVEKVEKIAAGIVNILNEGVKILINNPQYLYTRMDDLKIEMIGKATDNARRRASVIAREGHFRLGSIADVRVGVFQITPVHSTEVDDYGINDTTSINKEVKSVVEIKYFVR